MVTVLVSGTFDKLHPGHIAFFKQALQHGDELIVNVALDETVERVKGRHPAQSLQERKTAIQQFPFVKRVVSGYPDDPYRIIEEVAPDVICLGYDQKTFTKDLRRTLAQRKIEVKVIRLRPFKPETYKSSLLP